jgi:ubiquinol-cytochrome c reductase cytochrome c subunit
LRRAAARPLLLAFATVCGAFAVWSLAGRPPSAPAQAPPGAAVNALVASGRALFQQACSSCHGLDGRGVPGRGPSLIGAGAQAADFYLSTGRMPLADPRDAPVRTHPQFSRARIRALTAYVATFGGPPVPRVSPAAGNLSEGQRSFADHCAGCHQILARGGIVVGGIAPPLQQATATQVAEAVRIGPYLMPRFTRAEIPPHELNSLARYVAWTKSPDDRGGWGIGNIGPIPEGMVAWFLGIASLLVVALLIGERVRR